MTYNNNIDNNLPDRLNKFIIYLKAKSRSENTIKSYNSDMIMFFKFMKMYKENLQDIEFNNIDISDINLDFIKAITVEDIYIYLNFVSEQLKNSNYGKSRKLSVLKTFYKYLQDIKLITRDENIVVNIEKINIPKRQPIYLQNEEINKLLNTVLNDTSDNSTRDYCIITMFLNCGLRLFELANINFEDIKNDKIKVIGKGSKERFIPLNPMCINTLNEYIKERKLIQWRINNNDKNALFVSQMGNRMEKTSIEKMIKKYIKKADLNEKVTPHKLRHSFASILLKNGINLKAIQKLLGHEDLSTTMIYTHITSEDTKDAVNSINIEI